MSKWAKSGKTTPSVLSVGVEAKPSYFIYHYVFAQPSEGCRATVALLCFVCPPALWLQPQAFDTPTALSQLG